MVKFSSSWFRAIVGLALLALVWQSWSAGYSASRELLAQRESAAVEESPDNPDLSLNGTWLPSFASTSTHHASLAWGMIGAVLLAVTQLLLAVRWLLLLSPHVAQVSLSRLVNWQLRGQAIAIVALGQLGGDAVRAQQAMRGGIAKRPAVLSVLLERAIGTLAIIVVGAYGFIVGIQSGWIAIESRTFMILLVAGLLVMLILAGLIRWLPVARGRLKRSEAVRNAVSALLDGLRRSKSRLGLAFALSVAIHLAMVATCLAAARVVGAPASWPLFLTVVPVVSIVSCIPGLGGFLIPDASLAFLLARVGDMPPTAAIATSAMVRAFSLLPAAAGGVAMLLPTRCALPNAVAVDDATVPSTPVSAELTVESA